MADPLDDVRRALGIPVSGHDFPQEAGAGGTTASAFDGAAAQHEARAKAHEQEMMRLHQGGDNVDGLEELRRAFRRCGRG